MNEIDVLLEAVTQRAEALVAADGVRLRALLHPQFAWTSHAGEVFDRERYVAANTSGVLVWRRQIVHEAAVAIVGDTAVVTAVVSDDVERGGQRQTFKMPITQTWVRTIGGWRLLAGHAGPRFDRTMRNDPDTTCHAADGIVRRADERRGMSREPSIVRQ